MAGWVVLPEAGVAREGKNKSYRIQVVSKNFRWRGCVTWVGSAP